MNTKIDNDPMCEKKLTEAYCEIALRTLNELWSCNEEIPEELQYYRNEKKYYPETNFFTDTLSVPLDERDKILIQYLSKTNLAGRF